MTGLAIEIELLTGAYRASLPDRTGGEWPPHPDRLYSAFVQAWADGGHRDEERSALVWLETQPAPAIQASSPEDVAPRDSVVVFVPPNDQKDVELLPAERRRQPRSFHAMVAGSPVIRYLWDAPSDPGVVSSLAALCHRVASLGHSSSLVRASVAAVETPPAMLWEADADGPHSLRGVYPGRLDDLERWYSGASGRVERPRSASTQRYREPGASAQEVTPTVFGGPAQWFVFEDAGAAGTAPDILALAHVAKRVRDALMSLGPQPSAEIITGHSSTGERSERPHMAVVPLANVGWERSTGELLGFAVVLPRTTKPEERQAVLSALAGFIRFDEDGAGRAVLQLRDSHAWHLERAAAPSRSSLQPGRWCRASRRWASVTPVVLDRFPQEDDPVEEARIVAGSCRRIGLPEPTEMELHKHSAVRGATSAYPRKTAGQPSWSFPAGSKLADRPRRHVVLTFETPVQGPVILGAGRYHGFGLCLPVADHDR